MALFPQGLTQIDQRCNAGERRVLHQLKRCLGDDHMIWYDVPLGPKARQPDFVILSPRQGLLLLEVKDWRPNTLQHATPDRVELQVERGRVTVAHPIRQARDYAMELVHVMQNDMALVHAQGPLKGQLIFPYGWGAVLSGIRRADVVADDFEAIFPAHKTLLRDDLDEAMDEGDFLERLLGMFTVHFPYTLSLPQRDRIRWHLFPEIRLQPVQAALAFEGAEKEVSLPDLMQVMDLKQEQIARTLGEGHRVIHGVAGSGKTMILIFRAQQLVAAARPDYPILVMCFNRALAGHIETLLRRRGVDERVQVRTFHAWCEDIVRTYQLSIPVSRRDERYFEQLTETVGHALQTGFVPAGQYMALLIDEAHDFEDAWLRMAAKLVDPRTNSLLVLYDDAQSIYQKARRQFSFSSVGIQAQGRTSVLRFNYRNTTEILSLAARCAERLLEESAKSEVTDIAAVHPFSAGRHGPPPVLIEARHEREEVDLLTERIAAQQAEGMGLNEIAVLFRVKYLMRPLEEALRRRGIAVQSMGSQAFRRFDWKTPSVKLVTLHSAKGLEFSHVYVAGLHAMPYGNEDLEEEVRLLYVGMTRATQTLVLSAHGRSVIVDRVRNAIETERAA
ncbi:3'-5' exonuclease [Leptothrix ochracea]|uniref:3'-5' exonuclease n=1 Tax=Leptothrix ochracea TaxID=735331 RepID=UPI0034E21D01